MKRPGPKFPYASAVNAHGNEPHSFDAVVRAVHWSEDEAEWMYSVTCDGGAYYVPEGGLTPAIPTPAMIRAWMLGNMGEGFYGGELSPEELAEHAAFRFAIPLDADIPEVFHSVAREILLIP